MKPSKMFADIVSRSSFVRSVKRVVTVVCAVALAFAAQAAIVPPGQVQAGEVTPEQAVTAAQNWVRSNPRRLGSRFATGKAEEMESVSNMTGRTMFHAMNLEGGGYVITSGDTRLSPIVAFSTTGYYSGDRKGPLYALLQRGMRRRMAALEMQDNLVAAAPGGAGRGAVEQALTQDQIEAMSEWETLLSDNGGDRLYADGVGSKTSLDDVRVPVLLKTQWSQGSLQLNSDVYPTFNYYIYNNSQLGSASTRFPCGCVATAGAQMIYYWKAPSSFGSYSETCRWKVVSTDPWTSVTLTSISGTPAWSSMFEENPFADGPPYTIPSEAARKAVGMLTYNVAVAVGMDWMPGSGSGSLQFLTERMKSLFGYKSGTFVWYDIDAANYPDGYVPTDMNSRLADFNNALFASLDAKMPVFMSISGSGYDSYYDDAYALGHAIIADGYGYVSGKRYTHLNFGWLGDDDAWYCIPDEMVDFEYDDGSYDQYFEFDGLGFNVHPTTAGDVISGRVLNSSSSPASGATVTLYNSANTAIKTASTDAKGIYSLRVTAAGDYTVKATSGSYSSPAKAVSISHLSASGSYGYDIGYGGGLSGNRWGNDLKLGSSPTYTLTFNPNGGKLNGGNFGTHNGTTSSHGVTVTYGASSYSSIGTATKDGYTFNGWFTATSGGTKVYGADGKYVSGAYWNSSGKWAYSGNLTVYAQWTQNTAPATYTLTFNPNGGKLNGGNFGTHNGTTSSHGVTVTYGASSYSSIGTATKDGYTFNGWFTATSGGTKVYGADGKYVSGSYWNSSGKWSYNGSLTLYAQWTQAAKTYTLTCNPYGGKLNGGNFGTDNGKAVSHNITVTYGASSYGSLGTATRDGYTFKGWYTATSGGTQVYNSSGKCVTGTAYWNSSGKWAYSGNLTVYAQWTQNTAPATYTLTFNPNGGKLKGGNFGAHNGTTSSHGVTVTYGASSYSSIGTATKDGYTFNGWFTATSGGTKVYGADGKYVSGSYWNSSGKWSYNGSLTLYAQWTQAAKTYTLTCNPYGGKLNGGNFGTDNGKAVSHNITVTYGASSYSTLGTATRSGYAFQGWYTDPTGGYMVFDTDGKFVYGDYWDAYGKWQYSGNVTVYARWAANGTKCTLTCNPYGGKLSGGNFGADNGTSKLHDVTVTIGSTAYSTLGTATRDGYKFLGWYSDPTSGSQIYDANGKFVRGSWCWNAAGQWIYNGNPTIYARWAEAYTLTCDPNGGKLNGGNFGTDNGKATTHSVTLAKGTSAYSTLGTATRDGYVFMGWYTEDDEPVYDYDGTAYTRYKSNFWNVLDKTWRYSGNVTVYAKWESRSSYNLTCDPDGGTLKGGNFGADNGTSNAHAVTVTVGSSAYSTLGTAVRPGYKFTGWYRAEITGFMQYSRRERVFDENGKWVPSYIDWGGPWMWNKAGLWMYADNLRLLAGWEEID